MQDVYAQLKVETLTFSYKVKVTTADQKRDGCAA